VLVATRGELAEQPERGSGLRVEPDDVAQVGLRIEVATQRDMGPRAEQQQVDALRLGGEGVGHGRDHAGEVTSLEQLVRRCDDSAIHATRLSKRQATKNKS
jgi:hypothetical protein